MKPFTSVQHICQAERCKELRNQLLADGHDRQAIFWTELRLRKLHDAEIEKRREELTERLKGNV